MDTYNLYDDASVFFLFHENVSTVFVLTWTIKLSSFFIFLKQEFEADGRGNVSSAVLFNFLQPHGL